MRTFTPQPSDRADHLGILGFTLIELSMVLVVIALVIGGVLVGRDLIGMAEMRSQLTQIEKFYQATNTFKLKYGYLPGDLTATAASQNGFVSRSGNAYYGDGNGILESCGTNMPKGLTQGCGENALFWVDLSTDRLIEGNFTRTNTGGADFYGAAVVGWFPPSKFSNSYFYVYSWQGTNYFGLSSTLGLASVAVIYSQPHISVNAAQAIDTKMDDGLPQTGTVTAQYIDYGGNANQAPVYAAGATSIWGPYGPSGTNATNGSSTTCFDNGNVSNNVQQYSIRQKSGTGLNCALSFRF